MGLLSKILGRNRNDVKDAARIYARVMRQSRQPEFFGEGRFADNYDGRIDLLSFNLCFIMKRLRAFGENGQILSQAIFDLMRDDFEIALREQGLSDKGVAVRIKPMIRLFYDRLKAYDEAIDDNAISDALAKSLELESTTSFTGHIAEYGIAFHRHLNQLSLGDIATANFKFSPLEN